MPEALPPELYSMFSGLISNVRAPALLLSSHSPVIFTSNSPSGSPRLKVSTSSTKPKNLDPVNICRTPLNRISWSGPDDVSPLKFWLSIIAFELVYKSSHVPSMSLAWRVAIRLLFDDTSCSMRSETASRVPSLHSIPHGSLLDASFSLFMLVSNAISSSSLVALSSSTTSSTTSSSNKLSIMSYIASNPASSSPCSPPLQAVS
mmetsp:Transcript_25101/g.58780  ORF Transcript_25101/g.58780 Transcript_25101/m.58780 type:complete len:204 (+) Transcript_25101:66-677(+)